MLSFFMIVEWNKNMWYILYGEHMKKNGFTIVEILAVIVVLAGIMALIIPNLTNSSEKAKERLYNSKIESIKKAAIIYAQDNYNTLIEDATGSTVVVPIKLETLIAEKYVVADKTIDGKEVMIDPRTNGEFKVIVNVTINIENKKVTAEIE